MRVDGGRTNSGCRLPCSGCKAATHRTSYTESARSIGTQHFRITWQPTQHAMHLPCQPAASPPVKPHSSGRAPAGASRRRLRPVCSSAARRRSSTRAASGSTSTCKCQIGRGMQLNIVVSLPNGQKELNKCRWQQVIHQAATDAVPSIPHTPKRVTKSQPVLCTHHRLSARQEDQRLQLAAPRRRSGTLQRRHHFGSNASL